MAFRVYQGAAHGWHGHDRRKRLPPDWERRRRAVKRRANGRCEASQHVAECDGIGAECDHIIAGDNHQLENLQWLSPACHKAKTLAENSARGKREA